MVDRKVSAHNLVSSLDNNWEVGTRSDEKIEILIVFLLEVRAHLPQIVIRWKSFQL